MFRNSVLDRLASVFGGACGLGRVWSVMLQSARAMAGARLRARCRLGTISCCRAKGITPVSSGIVCLQWVILLGKWMFMGVAPRARARSRVRSLAYDWKGYIGLYLSLSIDTVIAPYNSLPRKLASAGEACSGLISGVSQKWENAAFSILFVCLKFRPWIGDTTCDWRGHMSVLARGHGQLLCLVGDTTLGGHTGELETAW